MSIFHEIFYTLPVAVALFASDDNAIPSILLVLWMMSRFHIMEPNDQNHRECCLYSLPGGSTGGEVADYDCMVALCKLHSQ